MAGHRSENGVIDFDAAASLFDMARESYESGDREHCTELLKLLALSLKLNEGLNGKLHTRHLERL